MSAHAVYVRNTVSGRVLPCCWGDCMRPGDTRYQWVEHDGAYRQTTYVYCSERHRLLALNSHVQLGQLPPGYRLTLL